MTTLATLKAEIADDIARTDLTTQIADAITKAIEHYQKRRFFFNETRDVTFSTVADQAIYTSADNADIPNFYKIDGLFITVSGHTYDLRRIDPLIMEHLQDDSASSGQSTSYSYFNQSLWLYPIPDQAYTVRTQGHIKVAVPATDAEADNVWMTHGYELIRARAKASVALHKIRDVELANEARAAELVALEALDAETSQRIGTGRIVPTSW